MITFSSQRQGWQAAPLQAAVFPATVDYDEMIAGAQEDIARAEQRTQFQHAATAAVPAPGLCETQTSAELHDCSAP